MGKLRKRLERLGRAIGRVQAFLFFSLVYWLVLFPIAMLTRWRWDPLARRHRQARWHALGQLPAELDAWRKHS